MRPLFPYDPLLDSDTETDAPVRPARAGLSPREARLAALERIRALREGRPIPDDAGPDTGADTGADTGDHDPIPVSVRAALF